MHKALFAAAILLVSQPGEMARASPVATPAAPITIRDGKIEANGVQYHYLISEGRGEPIVLLHGWGETSYMWRHVMPALAARGHRVIAPDLRGLGDTARPATGYERRTSRVISMPLSMHWGLGRASPSRDMIWAAWSPMPMPRNIAIRCRA